MLTTLRIRNLALVAELTLEFPAGLVVVTGETGAGKSIVLGALNLLLGQRADRTLIRADADACTVEAVFDLTSLSPAFHQLMAEHGLEPCEENQLLLKRSFTSAGANRQFINGTPTTVSVLTAVGDWLVDVHGPHDHQSLLQPARQLAILDAYGKLGDQVEAFGRLVRQRAQLAAAKAALIIDERTYAQQLDLLRFQAQEINEARLQPEEAREIEIEHQRASNASRLLQLSQELQHWLDGDDGAIMPHLGAVGRTLRELHRLDAGTANLVTLHEQAAAVLQELQSELADYVDRVEVDPARLEEIEQRLGLIQDLKRKYGTTLEEVIEFGAEAARKLEQLAGREGELIRLDGELARLDRELVSLGAKLSAKRRGLIPRLVKAVTQELTQLGFAQSRFDVAFQSVKGGREGPSETSSQPSSLGFDTVEFQFAPNPGEPPRPLRAIASSGEIARVMLAIKTVLAAEDQIPVLIFDEVDANVGGETANAVGQKMCEIARHRQVFCITHLAPVAAAATAHFRVSKEVRDARTFTRMEPLSATERVNELARMLGGQTEAARKHARALLKPVRAPRS